MEELNFDLTNSLSPMDMEYLESILEKSKKYGVQTGVTWSNDVFTYLFDSEYGINKINDVFGFDLSAEVI